MKNRYGYTRQGYKITNIYTSKSGRKYIVGKRNSDYFVGLGYDKNSGTWAQGIYNFNSKKKAQNKARYRAYRKNAW